MTIFYIALLFFGLLILGMILSDVPTRKPRLRIVKYYTNKVYYRVERMNLLGGWYIIQVPYGDKSVDPYSLDFKWLLWDNVFDTEKEANDWLQWYLDHRCEEYFKKPKIKIEKPKDQVIFKYKPK